MQSAALFVFAYDDGRCSAEQKQTACFRAVFLVQGIAYRIMPASGRSLRDAWCEDAPMRGSGAACGGLTGLRLPALFFL